MYSKPNSTWRCGRLQRRKVKWWTALILVVIVVYFLVAASIRIDDQSLSSLGFVESSDLGPPQRFVRKIPLFDGLTGGSPSTCRARAEVVPERLMGDACFFRDYIQCDDMPRIHSAFVDVVEKNVVFISTRFRDESWINDSFVCEFPDGNISVSDPLVIDQRSMGSQPQYVSVIICPIAEGFYTSFLPRRLPDRFTVNLRKNAPPFQSYQNIPLCKAGWNKVNYLAICTMVNNVNEYFEDWLLYYRYMGVDHVYVYDNSKSGTLVGVLDRFISLGFVTVIPWWHTFTPTKTYLEVQIAHENDCLWRHRHDTKWMLKIDVDEFVQPRFESETSLVDFLMDFEPKLPASVASIRVRNWFFSRPMGNLSKDFHRHIRNLSSVIERNPWRSATPTGEGRGREKCFIRPQMVHYYKIHTLKTGGDSVTLDPYTEMRLAHYRTENPRHRNFRIHRFIPDNSMVELWHRIKRWVLYSNDRVIMYGYRKHRNAEIT